VKIDDALLIQPGGRRDVGQIRTASPPYHTGISTVLTASLTASGSRPTRR